MPRCLPQQELSIFKRFLLGMLAFGGPIALGALTVKIGGFLAFWYLCYILMLIIPAALVLYLIYKYFFQIKAEKVEDRFENEGRDFLFALKERFNTPFNEILWDRSFRQRSRFSPRKPFDRLALSVSESWFTLPEKRQEQLMKDIYKDLREWIKVNRLEKNNHSIRLDFYKDVYKVSSLVGQCVDGRTMLVTGKK